MGRDTCKKLGGEIWCREENVARATANEDGEEPKTHTIDGHCHKFPLVLLLARLIFLGHAMRDKLHAVQSRKGGSERR